MTTTLEQPSDTAEAESGRRSLLRWLVVAGVVLVLVVGAWAVGFSSLLGAKTVTVQGVHVLTAAQVRTAAAIRPGAPLIRLDQGEVTRRVEGLPDVASAHVSLRYPSTVIVTVTERVAVGYVTTATAGAGFGLVDHSGRQFRTVTVAPAALPHFTLPAGAQAQPVGAAMANVAAALSGTPVLAQLASIQALEPGAITLALRDGRTVAWGSADRSADKARILPALLARPGTTFDVSNPDQVFSH
jgi:cell division protein FtsQ